MAVPVILSFFGNVLYKSSTDENSRKVNDDNDDDVCRWIKS